MRFWRGAVVLCVSLVTLCSTSCALLRGSKKDVTTTPPEMKAQMRATRAVFEAREEAFDDSESGSEHEVRVRYNPGRCGAPSDEILVYGSWHRVALVGKNERVELAIKEWKEQLEEDSLELLLVEGGWDKRDWLSASGVSWPVFEVNVVSSDVIRDRLTSGASTQESVARVDARELAQDRCHNVD